MPNCPYCSKILMSRQALGNHIKKHLDDSDEDFSLPNQAAQTSLGKITNKVLNNQTKFKRQNFSEETETNYKKICFEHNLSNSLEEVNFNVDESIKKQNPSVSSFNYINDTQYYKSSEKQDAKFFDNSNSQSNTSDEQSDLYDSQSNTSDDSRNITNVDINEFAEYDNLLAGKTKEPEDIYQRFPSKEYAEFMNIVSQFQNLDLPNFGWRKETILEYEGLEYTLEFRTVLDGIHQILINKSIAEEFIFEYKLSIDSINIYDSDWWRNVKQNIPIGAYVMPIILYSDATLCDHLGKTLRHSVFITIGNIPLACRNKVDTKFYLLPNTDNLWMCGFKQLKHCIYDYLQSIENWSLQNIKYNTVLIEVFDFAYLNNDDKIIIRASSSYHNQAIFSDICIEMDELEQEDYLMDNGLCYANILLITRITSPKLDQKLELALVYWYDFAYPSDINN
ncbi:8705_t:CDS:2 [Dentiscutata erythropus]|uniref:8705_t:CDS:1 n=1 Tax=Dentiscutata erythropus TaxID=1348616 RepID=A0A9N9B1E4_9GLOM|nr:8705_t:CDS:2 [Dentiscutata erythropus]